MESNFVGCTKALLLRFFPFIWKLKAGDIVTIGQYMNHQLFDNLQFRTWPKNCFQSFRIDLRDTSGGRIPLVSVRFTRLFLMFRKASIFFSKEKRRFTMVASRQVEIPFYTSIGRQRGSGFDALHKLVEEPQFHFGVNMSYHSQNVWVMAC